MTRDGKPIKLNGKPQGPFTVGKDALKGAGKAPARANSADAADGSADTGEYTFGFAEKEVQKSYRDTYTLIQDPTCTYPEDAYTNVQYSYSSSSENIYLVQDANNVLGNGEGRIYICNLNSGREAGTIIITAELQNGDEVVASDYYTVNIIIDFGFSEVSATATLGKPFTAPTLTNIYGTSVTYSVGNTQIATVDEKTGEVMPVSQGYTTVFAVLDADNNVTASYSLAVVGTFAFSSEEVTAFMGEEFTAPTLINGYGGTVMYFSDNEGVATVDINTGAVTIVGPGQTNIYAILEEAGREAYYVLTVVDRHSSVSLPYEKSFADGMDDFTIVNTQLEEGLSEAWTYDSKNQCVTASGFIDGSNRYVWSRLVSPFIDTASDKTGVLLSFDQAVDNGFDNIKYRAMLYVREEGGDWKMFDIEHPSVPDGETFSEFTNQTVNLSEFAGKRIQIAFEYISHENAAGTWRIKNLSVVAADIEAPKVFAFSESHATVTIGEDFTLPTLRNDYGGTVVYFSDNEGVATVDENGIVTILGSGQTNIYAILEEAGLDAQYTLKVIDPSSAGLPYEESFYNDKGQFTIDDVALGEGLSEVWTYDSGNQCMKASATVDGAGKASESWLVSPVIEGLTDAEQKYTISFEQAVDNRFGNVDGETTLWVREEGGEWEPLTITHPTASEDGTLSEFEAQTVNVLKYVGKKIQIGFRYTSSADAAGTWCIRNVSVNGVQRTFEFSVTEAAATIGEEFTPPTLINEYEGYEVRYRSERTNTATVDETTGEVTLVGRGWTRIYAELYDGDNYVRDTYYTLTVSGYPVVTLPYVENFDANIGQFIRESVKLAGNQSGVWAYSRNDHVMRAAPYASDAKKDVVMEQWLVSPIINAETDESTLYLSFDHAINKAFGDIATEATLWVREAGGEWSRLEIAYPAVEAGFITQVADLSAYIGKKIQIGFKYMGSMNSGGQWDIKNVQVSTDYREASKVFAFPTDYVEATIGEEFNAPKLTNTYGGTVYYTSDNNNVATVDENTGVVTLVGPGETNIVAFLEEEEQVAHYILKVIDPSSVGLPYNEDFMWDAGRFSIENTTLGDGLTDVWTHDDDNQSMKATAKVDGNSVVSESWLISPVIAGSTYNGLSLSFDQAVDNGFGNIAEEALLLVREEDGEWEPMAITYPSAEAGFETQTVNLSNYAGRRIQIAFLYNSSAEAAGTWSIKNVSVNAFSKRFEFSEGNVEATIGEDFNVPTLINDYEGEGPVSYDSGDTDVATVDENTGVVTLVGPGQTYIQATRQGEGWTETQYTLTVYDPSSVGVPYEEGFAEGMGRFTIENTTLGDGLTDVWTHDADNWCMKATAKIDGVNMASESWLVSPVIAKVSGERKITLTFEQAVDNGFGNMDEEMTLWAREEGGEWQQIAITHPAAPAEGAISEFEGQMVNLSAYAGKRFQFAFKYTSSAEAAGTWRVRNIWVEKADKVFAFSEDNVEATIGEDFTAPTLINDYEGGTISYSVSDTDVATVDENTGVVTFVGPGQTYITATQQGDDGHYTSYSLTVYDPSSVGVPYEENFAEGTGRFSIDNVTLGEGLMDVWTHDADNWCMKATAKVDGVSMATESWLVSPVIAKVSGDRKITLTFEQAVDNGFGDIDTEATLWAREEGGEWQQIAITHPAVPADGGFSEFEGLMVNLSAYAGKRFQFAFKYTSSAEAAGTWRVRNIMVEKADKVFAFSEYSVEATIGEGFTAPTLINDYEGEGTVVYSSNDENVAMIDYNTGVVTLVGQGTTQLWAHIVKEGEIVRSAGYTLTVKVNPIETTDRGNHVDFRAVGNDGMFYATFSSTENVVFPDAVEVKTVTVSNSKMTLKDVEKSLYVVDGDYSTLSYGYYVPKGSGVLLRSTQETVPYYSVTEENPGKALDADNMMRGVDGDGLFEAEEGYRYYKLAYDDYEKKTDLGFYYGAPDGDAFAVRAGLAYLAVPESAMSQTSEAAPTHFIFGGDGDVTTIRDVKVENSAKEPVIYNTAGQRVKTVGQPCVYIVNGRKVVVK